MGSSLVLLLMLLVDVHSFVCFFFPQTLLSLFFSSFPLFKSPPFLFFIVFFFSSFPFSSFTFLLLLMGIPLPSCLLDSPSHPFPLFPFSALPPFFASLLFFVPFSLSLLAGRQERETAEREERDKKKRAFSLFCVFSLPSFVPPSFSPSPQPFLHLRGRGSLRGVHISNVDTPLMAKPSLGSMAIAFTSSWPVAPRNLPLFRVREVAISWRIELDSKQYSTDILQPPPPRSKKEEWAYITCAADDNRIVVCM